MGQVLDTTLQYKVFINKMEAHLSSLVRSCGATHNSLPSGETALTWNSTRNGSDRVIAKGIKITPSFDKEGEL